MRFFIAVTSVLGLVAATPCKPKSTITLASSALATATSSSVSSAIGATSTETSATIASTSSVFVTSSTASSSAPSTTGATSSTATTSTTPAGSTSSSASSTPTAPSASTTSTASSSISSSVSSTSVVTPTSATSTSSSSTSSSTSSIPVATSTSATSTSTSISLTTAYNPATASVTNPTALIYYQSYQSNPSGGTSGRNPAGSGYVCFAGPSINFPPATTWINFDQMFANAQSYSFTPFGATTDEQQDILSSILTISSIAKVDPRVILAVILDESSGNLNVGCTNNGVQNCGLMQAYNSTSFDPNNPAASIRQMIQDGTQGTIYGPGLVQDLNDSRSAGNLWVALRLYNSGSANKANLSDGRGATPQYVSNIANFLQGWNGYGDGPKYCDFTQPFDSEPNPPAPTPTD